ncbi:uncharacterized protein SCHCODRAFT_02184807 [Schizophyllum commune H4-8]|uniref:uncharacterized protein n=1 Tax=Schizophyllum commune (strain H4-8 / FGSC 9210) TaxID=578458 RepID=UPI00215F4FFE|nr:uncharacterized protein SCHCODRAFT_02184807 [Schizophyllum commune H4-8]KAI5896155.1 hypothetical protein SCHCODRAFT_02184807 [Schizophyllum commune H4-8]
MSPLNYPPAWPSALCSHLVSHRLVTPRAIDPIFRPRLVLSASGWYSVLFSGFQALPSASRCFSRVRSYFPRAQTPYPPPQIGRMK